MLRVSWGLLGSLWDRLGRLWAVLGALGAQEWSKSAPRAVQEQPKSAIFENRALPAPGGLILRPCALAATRGTQKGPKPKGYLIASRIPLGRVGPICLDDVDKALYA